MTLFKYYCFVFSFLCFTKTNGQYLVKFDTSVVSKSNYYKDDGVIFSMIKIPKGDSILNLSKKRFNDELNEGSHLEAQSIEMVFDNGVFKVPHECIKIEIGDLSLQHTFPDIAYSLSRDSILERNFISVITACNSIELSEHFEISFYYNDFRINKLEVTTGNTFSQEMHKLLTFSSYIIINLHSKDFPGLSSPIKISLF